MLTSKRVFSGVVVLLLFFAVASAQAQTTRGSIRGRVYLDVDANGFCVGTTEPALAGIPVQFVSADGQTTVDLQSGSDGSFGLASAGLGTWQVTAKPGTGYRVTSQQTRTVTITEQQPVATGADFCVAQVTTSTGGTGGVVVLPESGATVAPGLIWAVAVGLVLLVGAALLEWRRRRNI